MNLTLTMAILLIAAGLLALLVGVVLEGTIRSRRQPEPKTRDMKPVNQVNEAQ